MASSTSMDARSGAGAWRLRLRLLLRRRPACTPTVLRWCVVAVVVVVVKDAAGPANSRAQPAAALATGAVVGLLILWSVARCALGQPIDIRHE
jgi:hypothetical protein